MVCVDPHSQSLAWDAFTQLVARGHKNRILFDRLSHFDHVLGYDLGRPSRADHPLRRQAENEAIVEQLTELVCRRRGQSDLAQSPQTEEFTRAAIQLVLHQNPGRPASDLRFAFQTEHPRFRYLIDHCEHEEAKLKFEQIATGKTRPGWFASAARLIEPTVGSSVFGVRCGASFNLGSFLNQRGILFIEGGAGGVAEDGKRTVMGAVILRTIQFIRARRRAEPRVLLVLDEAANAGLIGEAGHEVRAMAETQKYGLDFLVLVQSPSFSKHTTEQLLSNAVRHEYFYQANDSVARAAASDLGDSNLRNEIRQLRIGERYVKDRHRVFKEYVEMMSDPWGYLGLSEAKARTALGEIRRSRPEYIQPSQEEFTWLPNTSASHKTETNGSSNSPRNTSASSDISKLSSPADRLATDASQRFDDESDYE